MYILIDAIAGSVGVCAAMLYSICSVESSGKNVLKHNDGGSPSYGVCQIKLSTAKLFNPDVTPTMLMTPEENVLYAALYLKKQQARYPKSTECTVASYNAGKCKKDDNGKIKNKDYVKKVKAIYRNNNRKGILSDKRHCPEHF